jgi:hypothetical protein
VNIAKMLYVSEKQGTLWKERSNETESPPRGFPSRDESAPRAYKTFNLVKEGSDGLLETMSDVFHDGIPSGSRGKFVHQQTISI